MRLSWIGCVATIAMLSTMPAVAQDRTVPGSHAWSYATTDPGGAEVTLVNRGQMLAIACDTIAKPGADVRVVMSLEAVEGETPTGYQAVLITEQTVGGSAVRIRVPDVTDLVNHTVTLRVYVTDQSGTTASCNAGHIRIV